MSLYPPEHCHRPDGNGQFCRRCASAQAIIQGGLFALLLVLLTLLLMAGSLGIFTPLGAATSLYAALLFVLHAVIDQPNPH